MHGQLYVHDVVINEDGTVSPPDVPGAGLEPNYPALERFRVF